MEKQNIQSDFKDRQKNKNRIQLIVWIIGFIVVVLGGLFWNVQTDWTSDRKYSITTSTKEVLTQLQQPIHVEVFLSGEELPAAFKKLSKSSEVLLRQFRNMSKNKLTFSFTDPLSDKNEEALQKLSHFKMAGLPVTISDGKKGTTQRMVFPWALITIQNPDGSLNYQPVFLQSTNTPELSRAILNRSEMLLEYHFIEAILALSHTDKPGIAYLMGNGQPFGYEVIGMLSEIGGFYHFDTLNLQQNLTIPNEYKTLMINRPTETFSEVDKYKIDQYIVSGGQVVWIVDGATGNLDSLQATGQYNSMPVDLNLTDMFFHYGFRVNQNLVLDGLNHVMIPLAAQGFDQAQATLFPWLYYPILEANQEHPIGQQIMGVLSQFPSSIDFNENDPNIHKTVLLHSSQYSKKIAVPAPVQLETAMEQIDERSLDEQNLIVAALLEGPMTSWYARRQPQEVQDFIQMNQLHTIRSTERENRMMIIADGSIFINRFSETTGPSELGTFRFSDYVFDNKVLLKNILTFLNKGEELLTAKGKQFETRLLDPQTVKKYRTRMQWLNIGVPVLIYIIFAGIWLGLRRRKYA